MKQVVIINGKGGCGKDTFCAQVRAARPTGSVCVFSSIDCVKYVALAGGWDGEKDEKGRRLLSRLKEAFAEYNDLPFEDTKNAWRRFMEDDDAEILFIHIREMGEIEKTAEWIRGRGGRVCTLLLRRTAPGWRPAGGNPSDDGAERGEYDYVYENRFQRGHGMESDMENYFHALLANEALKEAKVGIDRAIEKLQSCCKAVAVSCTKKE